MAGEVIGAELARQIGSGLDRLSDALIADRESSENWRKHLDRKIDEKFAALERRLDTVCDKGQGEHKNFETRLNALELRMIATESRAAGRADILRPAIEWAGKNWVALIVAAAFTFHSYVMPAIARAFTGPAQTVEIRGAL